MVNPADYSRISNGKISKAMEKGVDRVEEE